MLLWICLLRFNRRSVHTFYSPLYHILPIPQLFLPIFHTPHLHYPITHIESRKYHHLHLYVHLFNMSKISLLHQFSQIQFLCIRSLFTQTFNIPGWWIGIVSTSKLHSERATYTAGHRDSKLTLYHWYTKGHGYHSFLFGTTLGSAATFTIRTSSTGG